MKMSQSQIESNINDSAVQEDRLVNPDRMEEFLAKSARRHKHLCPRQVLGVRMGMLAARYLDFEVPQQKKRLLTIVESDGCFADGIEAATGCSMGHRTLRLMDYGKVAAVFIDTETGDSFRLAPALDVRQVAETYGEGRGRWQRQLTGYQCMPIELLFTMQWVSIKDSIEAIVSRPKIRTACCVCGEEIINERETIIDGRIFCTACAGGAYYESASAPLKQKYHEDVKQLR